MRSMFVCFERGVTRTEVGRKHLRNALSKPSLIMAGNTGGFYVIITIEGCFIRFLNNSAAGAASAKGQLLINLL